MTGIQRTRRAGWRLRRRGGCRPYVALREPFTVRAILAEHQVLGVTLTDVDAAVIACHRTPPGSAAPGPPASS